MRPTPEQIAEARTVAKAYADAAELIGDKSRLANAMKILYAATEPPTDEAIYATANTLWNDAVAENEPDFNEGVHAGIRHVLGPVKP